MTEQISVAVWVVDPPDRRPELALPTHGNGYAACSRVYRCDH